MGRTCYDVIMFYGKVFLTSKSGSFSVMLNSPILIAVNMSDLNGLVVPQVPTMGRTCYDVIMFLV